MTLSQATLLDIATQAAVMNRDDNARLRTENEALKTEVKLLRDALSRIEDYCDNGGSDPRNISRWASRALQGVPFWEKAPTE